MDSFRNTHPNAQRTYQKFPQKYLRFFRDSFGDFFKTFFQKFLQRFLQTFCQNFPPGFEHIQGLLHECFQEYHNKFSNDCSVTQLRQNLFRDSSRFLHDFRMSPRKLSRNIYFVMSTGISLKNCLQIFLGIYTAVHPFLCLDIPRIILSEFFSKILSICFFRYSKRISKDSFRNSTKLLIPVISPKIKIFRTFSFDIFRSDPWIPSDIPPGLHPSNTHG